MPDLATAAASALAEQGRFVAVTGRHAGQLAPIAEASLRTVVAPGPGTRLPIAAGVIAGGHRPVIVVDAPLPAVADAPDVLTVTEDPAVAAQAVRAGWQVAQPWARADVAPLLARVTLPSLLFLGSAAAAPGHAGDDVLSARPVREWERGELATLAASGPAVGAMLELGARLRSRGVDIAMLEIALLTRPEMEPLAGGGAVVVAGRGAVHAWRRGEWPTGRVDAVSLEGGVDADLVGAVMALVPAT